MAKGLNKHKERIEALNSFGRPLTKRSGSKCEFCEEKGLRLNIFEVPPIPEEPDIENCAFVCDKCLDSIKRFRKIDSNNLRFLNSSLWSEIPIVQSVSLFILRQMSNITWANDLLDNSYPSEEVKNNSYHFDL